MKLEEMICRVAGHRRSREQATYDGVTFNSRCKRCGAPMTRLATGDWTVNS